MSEYHLHTILPTWRPRKHARREVGETLSLVNVGQEILYGNTWRLLGNISGCMKLKFAEHSLRTSWKIPQCNI